MQRPDILLLTYSGHDASVDVLTFVELQPSSIYIYMVPECLPPQMAYGDSAVCPVSPTLLNIITNTSESSPASCSTLSLSVDYSKCVKVSIVTSLPLPYLNLGLGSNGTKAH